MKNLHDIFSSLFSSWDNAFGSGVGEGGGIVGTDTGFDEALSGTQMAGKTNTTTSPRAYLNYIFFDLEMSYVTAGYKQISTAAEGIGAHDVVQINDFISDQAGYLLAYVSNENNLSSLRVTL